MSTPRESFMKFDHKLKILVKILLKQIVLKEAEMDTIAEFLDRSIKGEKCAVETEAFIDKFRQAHYSFDT